MVDEQMAEVCMVPVTVLLVSNVILWFLWFC